MKTTVNLSNFRDAFQSHGRQDQFSYEAQELLFDYFEEMEDGTGEEIELDVIAICCEYSEDTVEDIAEQYNIDLEDCDDDDEKSERVMDYLNDHTSVVGEVSGSIVYAQF